MSVLTSVLLRSTAFVRPFAGPAAVLNYYIDAEFGNDGNDGKSTTSAWQTTAPLTWTPDFDLQAKTIAFKAGGVYPQTVWGIHLTAGISAAQRTVYTSYGTGPRPVLQGLQQKIAGPWTQVIGPILNLGDLAEGEWEALNAAPPGWLVSVDGVDQTHPNQDPDADITYGVDTAIVGSPNGWQAGCLKVKSSATHGAFALWDFESSGFVAAPICYFRWEFIVTEMSGAAAGGTVIASAFNDYKGTGNIAPIFTVSVVPDGAGFHLELAETASTPTLIDSGFNATFDKWESGPLAIGQVVLAEVEYDSTNRRWGWKVNGVELQSGDFHDLNTCGSCNLAFWGADLNGVGSPMTIYFDGTSINSNQYLGPIFREIGPTGVWSGPAGDLPAPQQGVNAPYLMYAHDGHIMQHAARTVDRVISTDSWYLDPVANLMWVYKKTTPTTYTAATAYYVANARGIPFITFDGLDFMSAAIGVQIGSAHEQTVQNCTGRECSISGIASNGFGAEGRTPTDADLSVNNLITRSLAYNCGSTGISIAGSGLMFYKNLEVSYNEVHDTCWDYGHTQNDEFEAYAFNAGIKLYCNDPPPNSGMSAWVHHNSTHHNGNGNRVAAVPNSERSLSGFGMWLDTWDGTAIVEHNAIWMNQARGLMFEIMQKGSIAIARFNLLYLNNSKGAAANLYSPCEMTLSRGMRNAIYENNTVYAGTSWCIGIEGSDTPAAEDPSINQRTGNCTVRNNIFACSPNAAGPLYMTGPNFGMEFQNNCYGPEGLVEYGNIGQTFDQFGNPVQVNYTTLAATIAACPGATFVGSITADPMFVNAAANDFRLQPGSPCIGTGITGTAALTDYDGVFLVAPPGIGAYQA